MRLILLWALVALIGRGDGKCTVVLIPDDERSLAYACTHGDLNDLEEISSEAEWIEFSVSRFHHLPDNAFRRFKNLRRLSFYNCHVNFIDPSAFAGLERLEWLILHGTRLHVARAAWFDSLRSLRKLILDRCGLEDIEPGVFDLLPMLETLSLRDNDLNCLLTEELYYQPNLRAVRVDGNPWLCECRQRMDQYFRARLINQEVDCSSDVYICKNYQCMTQIGFPALSTSFTTQRWNNTDREHTITHRNEFQTNVLTSLDRLPDKTTWIEISGLTIDTLPRYAFFRFGNSLRSLDLSGCRIGRIEGGAFAGLHRLQRLSLVGNRLTTVGADWFRDLVNLQQLILHGNDIQQIERTALWQVGGSLRYLDIRDNRLRCIAMEELAALKKLERVDATGNPWLCSCRSNMQNLLTQRNVGFQINAGRCYENEGKIPDGASGQTIIESTSVSSGKVHWTSFEESVRDWNLTVIRPRPSTPPPKHFTTPQPPLYNGSCYAETTTHRSQSFYTCRAITSIEDLNVIPPTARAIRVVLSKIKRIPANTFARFDGYLSKLELRDCGIEEIESGAFWGVRNLEHLSLRDNQLESINPGMVQGLTNLRHLDLSRNNIYGIRNEVFDALPYLTSLDVAENAMNCIGVEYMAQCLRYLSTMQVAGNPWSCLCGSKLAEVLDTRGIRYDKDALVLKEDCWKTQTPSVTAATTAATPAATPGSVIENETVEGSCIADEDAAGIRYRCSGGNLPLLQSLGTEATAIEFLQGHLPRLPKGCFLKFPNLRELVITNSGLATIEQGAFDGLNKLENLTIQDNPLEMVGSSWFVLGNLQRLDLRGNSIKYIAPGAFRHLNRLSYLNLEGNDLKCIFTSDLNDLPEVYIVEFAGNPLKWRCRVELEQFLEARKIRFVRIENSCEGKKLVRNLLLQNRTDGSFDCPSECSMANNFDAGAFFSVLMFAILVTWAH